MNQKELENRIKDLELELSNLKSGIIATEEAVIQAEQAVKKSNQLLKDTGKMAKVGGWEFDVETLEQVWTEEVYNIHEIDMTYKPVVSEGINFYAPMSRPIIERAVQRAIEYGEPFDVELEFITAKGNLRWIHAIGKADQEHGKVLGTIQDITERKQAEEALKKSQMLLISSIENQKDTIIFSIDKNYQYLYFNKAHRDTMKYAYNMDVKMGMNIMDCITAEDDKIAAKNNYDLALRGESHSNIRVFGDVNHAYYESFFNPVLDDNNAIIGCTGLARNITDRKKMEEKLLFLSKAIESASDAIGICDAQGRHFFQNKAFTDLFGYSTAEEMEAAGGIANVTKNPEATKDNIIAIINGKSWSGELEMVTKSGHVFPAYQRADAIKDSECNIIGLIGVITDITKRKQLEKEKQKNEVLFKSVVENSIDLITLTDEKGIVTYISPQCESVLGYPRSKFIGRIFPDIIHPDDKTKCQHEWEQVFLHGKELHEFEYRIIDVQDNVRWLSHNAKLTKVNDKPLSIQSTIRNITRRKKAEEKLIESEEKYRNLFNNSEVGMFRTRLDGSEILEFNKKYLDILKYSMEEIKGSPSVNMWVNKQKRDMMVKQLKDEGHVTDLELELFTKEKDVINCITSLRLYPDTGILEGSIQDITKRKQMEKVLIESESSLRNAQEIANMGSWEWDLVTQKTKWSHNYYAISGFKFTEVEPSFEIFRSRIHPDDVHTLDKNYSAIMKHKTPSSIELRLIQPDGTFKWIQNNISPVIEDNKMVKLKGVIIDITERKHKEEEIKNIKDSLVMLNHRFEEISENQRTFIAGEIHDRLGQSLIALKIDINWLCSKVASDTEEAAKLKGIDELLSSLIKDVQVLSFELHPAMLEEIGLYATIGWYSEEFEKRTGIKCRLKLHEVQFTDEKKNLAIYRILQEALTNVARHAKARNVELNLYQAEDSIILEVIDDGRGIEKVKINSYKSLGLIGMREKIKKYDGSMEISSALNKGTKLSICIPLN